MIINTATTGARPNEDDTSGMLLASPPSPRSALAAGAQAQNAMTFFVTSAGPGKGGDLGGLAGADAHCATLATAAGATGKTWRAYLRTQGAGRGERQGPHRQRPVAERQGRGGREGRRRPAQRSNNLTKQTALTEKGEVVNGRGDTPNRHDILTGSQADGTAFPARRPHLRQLDQERRRRRDGRPHDRTGLDDSAPAKSWNSSHPSRGPGGGCSQADLKSTGGDGLFYCFATNDGRST